MQMLKSFYGDLVPVYYGEGRIFFVAETVCLLMMVRGKIALNERLIICIGSVYLTMKNLFYIPREWGGEVISFDQFWYLKGNRKFL